MTTLGCSGVSATNPRPWRTSSDDARYRLPQESQLIIGMEHKYAPVDVHTVMSSGLGCASQRGLSQSQHLQVERVPEQEIGRAHV